MNTYGDPSGNSLAYVTLVGILIFVITFLFLEALYYKALDDEHQVKVVERVPVELDGVRREQDRILNSYGVQANFEEGRTRISIPIDRAMQMVLEEGEAALMGDPNAAGGTAARDNEANTSEQDTDAG